MDRNEMLSVAKILLNIEWQWDRSWWDSLASELNLNSTKSPESRRSYVDANGYLWSAYFDRDKLEFLEINMLIFEDVESLSNSTYKEKADEFSQKFKDAVHDLIAIFGNPIFSDSWAAEGFPDDQDAIWLALWKGENARLMLEQKNEARDLPFRLCFIVAP